MLSEDRVFNDTAYVPANGAKNPCADDFQQLLMLELGHRLSNVFALVLAVTKQTLRSATNLEVAAEALENRLSAMAGAHQLLVETKNEMTSVLRVVERALEPFAIGTSALLVSGPDIDLCPREALGLSLVMHELATNAIKHGALSIPSGRVDITWVVDGAGDRRLCSLRWLEHGGPDVLEPTRHGLGSILIKRALGTEAVVDVDYARSGFRFTTTFPATARSGR